MSEFEFDALLSYSSLNNPRVRSIAKQLKANGIRVWFDEWIIKPGDDIYLAIERGLQTSRCLILCLSPSAVGSDWVALERSTVLFRDPANKKRRFTPLLIVDCDIPDALRRYKRIDFRQRSKAAFMELLCALRETATPASTTRDAPADTHGEIAGLVRSRRNEWQRLRVDFESAARAYHDLEMKVFFATLHVERAISSAEPCN